MTADRKQLLEPQTAILRKFDMYANARVHMLAAGP